MGLSSSELLKSVTLPSPLPRKAKGRHPSYGADPQSLMVPLTGLETVDVSKRVLAGFVRVLEKMQL